MGHSSTFRTLCYEKLNNLFRRKKSHIGNEAILPDFVESTLSRSVSEQSCHNKYYNFNHSPCPRKTSTIDSVSSVNSTISRKLGQDHCSCGSRLHPTNDVQRYYHQTCNNVSSYTKKRHSFSFAMSCRRMNSQDSMSGSWSDSLRACSTSSSLKSNPIPIRLSCSRINHQYKSPSSPNTKGTRSLPLNSEVTLAPPLSSLGTIPLPPTSCCIQAPPNINPFETSPHRTGRIS